MTDRLNRKKTVSQTAAEECVKGERYIMARIMWWKETGLHRTYVSFRVGLYP